MYYDVVVVDEPNILFAMSEKQALLNFVANGGGLFMIADHTLSDRDADGFDSVTIWTDFLGDNGLVFNPFGIYFPNWDTGSNESGKNTFNHNILGDPILNGPVGVATNMEYFNGNEFQIDNTKNPTVISHMWFGALGDSNNCCGLASLRYGNGRVVCGDSSCFDDGTGDPHDSSLYDGYTTDAGGVQHIWILNASEWLAAPFVSSTVKVSALAREGNDIRITWSTVSGKTNFVQASNGTLNNFTNISSAIICPGISRTSTNYLDTGAVNNCSSRFYRIRFVP